MSLENISKNPFFFLLHFCKKYKFKIFLYYLFFICENILYLYGSSFFYEKLVNSFLKNSLKYEKMLLLVFLISFSLVAIFLSVIFRRFIELKSFELIKKDLRNALFENALEHDMDFFNNRFSGDISNKINSLIANFQVLYTRTTYVLNNSVAFSLVILYVFKIDYRISVFFIIWFIVLFLSIKFLLRRNFMLSKKASEEQSKSAGIINDCFKNISLIKAFSNEKKEYNVVRKQSINILKKINETMKSQAYMMAINYFFEVVFIITSFAMLFILYKNKDIEFGRLLFFSQIIINVNGWSRHCIDCIIKITDTLGRAKNSMETLMEAIKVNNDKNAKNIKVEQGKIVIKDLGFSYKNYLCRRSNG